MRADNRRPKPCFTLCSSSSWIDGFHQSVHHTLYVAVREQAGREASPTAAAIDLLGAKGAQKGGLGSILRATTRQEDQGRKRHILVDAMGLLLSAVVHPADVQDRDGAFQLLRRARRLLSFIERIADGGYAGSKIALVVCARHGGCASSSVSMLPASRSCPNAGIVEQTFAWISRNRRLARDFERYATTVVAFVRFAAQAARCKHLGMNLNFPDGPLDTHSNM